MLCVTVAEFLLLLLFAYFKAYAFWCSVYPILEELKKGTFGPPFAPLFKLYFLFSNMELPFLMKSVESY